MTFNASLESSACFPQAPLVHEVFTPTEILLKQFENGIGASRRRKMFRWLGSETAPEFTNDPEETVILVTCLGTLQATFDHACEAMEKLFPAFHRWAGLLSDDEHLQLLLNERFVPWSLQWQRIKLNAYLNESPNDVRVGQRLPGIGSIFLPVQHPERIRQINGASRPALWMSGLRCRSPIERSSRSLALPHRTNMHRTPTVTFNHAKNRVELGASWSADVEPGFAVPILIDGVRP